TPSRPSATTTVPHGTWRSCMRRRKPLLADGSAPVPSPSWRRSGSRTTGRENAMSIANTERPETTTHREQHERGIWRGTYVVYNLGLLGVGLAAGGALPLAALVLSQGTLVGIALVPVLTWAGAALLIGAVHAVHAQDLTTDIRPLRRLGRGVRQSLRQSVARWGPVGLMAALLLEAAALQRRRGPALTGPPPRGALAGRTWRAWFPSPPSRRPRSSAESLPPASPPAVARCGGTLAVPWASRAAACSASCCSAWCACASSPSWANGCCSSR